MRNVLRNIANAINTYEAQIDEDVQALQARCIEILYSSAKCDGYIGTCIDVERDVVARVVACNFKALGFSATIKRDTHSGKQLLNISLNKNKLAQLIEDEQDAYNSVS